jgi:hypothetical protein
MNGPQNYYLFRETGLHLGPTSAENLAEKILSGALPADALVGAVGGSAWEPVGAVTGVRDALVRLKTSAPFLADGAPTEISHVPSQVRNGPASQKGRVAPPVPIAASAPTPLRVPSVHPAAGQGHAAVVLEALSLAGQSPSEAPAAHVAPSASTAPSAKPALPDPATTLEASPSPKGPAVQKPGATLVGDAQGQSGPTPSPQASAPTQTAAAPTPSVAPAQATGPAVAVAAKPTPATAAAGPKLDPRYAFLPLVIFGVCGAFASVMTVITLIAR